MVHHIYMNSSKGGRRSTGMNKKLLAKLKHKRKCTRDGSRIRSPRRDIETLTKYAGM